MSILFSRSCEYATQAVLLLAQRPAGEPLLLREIADRLKIPFHFLSKVLQLLARDGIVVSHKGAYGGFSLARPADEVKLMDIVRAVDGEAFLNECVLGFPGCGDESPCPVHPHWKRSKDIVLRLLDQKTVAELSKGMDDKMRYLDQHGRS